MMDFMDAFVDSENAACGFSITYDLRALHAPSLSMVTRVAEWGGDPVRQEKWERLNHTCKVVVSSGIKYTLCKTMLSTFFFLCPPVCRTFLLTDPDEAEETAVVFMPTRACASLRCETTATAGVPSERLAAQADPEGYRSSAADDRERRLHAAAQCEQLAMTAHDPNALWLLPGF